MKTRYKSVASYQGILAIFVVPLIMTVLISAFFPLALDGQLLLKNWLILFLYYAFFWMALFVPYHNAFCRFEMNELGLKNRKVTIAWEDVDNILIREVDIFSTSIPFIRLKKIACIGNVSDHFISQKAGLCVFFSITRKNLEALEHFAKGKSVAVDEFLKRFYTDKETN